MTWRARSAAFAVPLLHRFGELLRALAQRIERAALRVDRAVGVALAEIAFGFTHRLAGVAELVGCLILSLVLSLALPLSALALALCLTLPLSLPLLTVAILAEAFVLQLLEQFAQAVAQRLLALP